MFGKRTKAKPKTEKVKERGLTLFKLDLPPIVFVALVVLVCGYLSYLQYASLYKEAEQGQHVAGAEKVAAQLGGRLIALGDEVARQAKASDALRQALASDSNDMLRNLEYGLTAHFPDATRIRIIREGETTPDNSVMPPVSYACLDLARQAEEGKGRPPIEIHLHGLEAEHMDIVRPIKDNGKVVASLVVSYAPARVQEWLKGLALQGAFVELKQGWEGPSLGQVGNRALRVGEPVHRAMVPASSWELSYWAEVSNGLTDTKQLTFLMTFAIAVGLIVVVMLIYSKFTASIFKRELNGMAEFMIESSRGKRFHSYPVKMVEMEKTLHLMEQALGTTLQKVGDTNGEDAEDEGADMMFMDFGEITVEEESVPNADESKQ